MSATKNNSVDGSFYNMLNKYNLASETLPGTTTATSNASVSPLFFPRAGIINSSSGSQVSDYIGYSGNGYYWSSTIEAANAAYLLTFTTTAVKPSGVGYRNIGYPVRCLVN